MDGWMDGWGWINEKIDTDPSPAYNDLTYNSLTLLWCKGIPVQPFWLSLLVQYSVNYLRYSTHFYNVDFVLNDLFGAYFK
jgi:hypothetical protein